MSISFSALKIHRYEPKWKQVGEPEHFDDDTQESIASLEVVSGAYGNSVKMTFVDGCLAYLDMDAGDTTPIGTLLDKSHITIVALKKDDRTIYRVRA